MRRIVVFAGIACLFASTPLFAASGTGTGGYSWLDSDEPGGPSGAYETVAVPSMSLGLCSEEVIAVPIGFSFPFYGASYTTVTISANGLLYLSGAPSCTANTAACADKVNQTLTGTEGSAFIAPLWDDWAMDNDDPFLFFCGDPGCSNSGIFSGVESHRYGSGTDLDGTAFFDVEWFDTAHHDPCTEPDTATFMARLFEDGRILFRYLDTNVGDSTLDFGASATIGLSSGLNDEFTEVSFDTGWLPAAEHAILFTPPGACADADADGFCSTAEGGTDCDDTDPGIHPGAVESCDGVDQDCDGRIDNDTPCFDDDGDGFTENGGDCDDTDPSVSPAAPELCDGIDNNCNNVIDESSDADADGFPVCGAFPDCDDTDPSVHPGAPELCDGIDNNCNGLTDEGFAADVDGDGWDTPACGGADCDDNNPLVNPGRAETCDGFDNDCDTLVDEGFDADNDGYPTCPVGPDPADCDDTRPDVNPGAVEICDPGVALDNDCDGEVDEGFDQDGDGYSSCNGIDCDDSDVTVNPAAVELCDQRDNDCNGLIDEPFDLDGDGYAGLPCGEDCDDTDPRINPDAEELCSDTIDNNCDGIDGIDADGDGFPDPDCPPDADPADCDDNDPDTWPGADELCDDRVDNDCDTIIDEGCGSSDDDDGGGGPIGPSTGCDCSGRGAGTLLLPLLFISGGLVNRRRTAHIVRS